MAMSCPSPLVMLFSRSSSAGVRDSPRSANLKETKISVELFSLFCMMFVLRTKLLELHSDVVPHFLNICPILNLHSHMLRNRLKLQRDIIAECRCTVVKLPSLKCGGGTFITVKTSRAGPFSTLNTSLKTYPTHYKQTLTSSPLIY